MGNKNFYELYKLKIIILLTFWANIFLGYSQSCHNVKELYRKRHKVSEMTYGHPYPHCSESCALGNSLADSE